MIAISLLYTSNSLLEPRCTIVIYNLVQRVSLELVVADYDRIGSSDPIGRVEVGYNRKGENIRAIAKLSIYSYSL